MEPPGAFDANGKRARGIIGLRPIEPDAENAYAVRPATQTSGPYVVSAMAFLRYYDIDTGVSRRWPATIDDGVLCIALAGDDGTAVTSNRARRGAGCVVEN